MAQYTVTAGYKEANPNCGYDGFHAPRFEFIIELLRSFARDSGAPVLDIGRSHLTTMIARELRTRVDSLGLEPDEQFPNGRHYCFDLNAARYRDRWPSTLGSYRTIICAEVIEHLHTPPKFALDFLRHLLVPDGLIIVQTPNAVSLGKRIKMALGRNPFEQIRADDANPGHYREYTLAEVSALLEDAQFSVKRTFRKYYFDARFARHSVGNEQPTQIRGSIKNVLYRFLPPGMREGITIVAGRT